MDKGASEMRPYYGPGREENAGNADDADDVMSLGATIDDRDAARVDADIDADVQPVISSAIYVPSIPDPGVEADIDTGDTSGPSTPVLSGELVGVSVSDDPDELRVGIEQTRTEMTGTINAIQEKLNPSVLMDQAKSTLHDATADILEQAKDTLHEATTDILDNAKDTVREATVGRVENMVSNAADTAKSTGSSVVELIKQNPIPAAVVGLGLGWLLTRNRGSSSGNQGMYSPRDYGYGPQGYGYGQQGYGGRNYGQSYGAGMSGQPENMVGQVVDGIKQNPVPAALAGAGIGWWLLNRQGSAGMPHTPGDTYGGYYSPYTPGSTQSQGGGKDVMGRMQDKVGDVAGQAGDTVGQVAGQVGDTASDVASKVGDVVGQAGDVAGSVAGQVGQVAGNVAGAVGHTAGNMASGTGDLAGNLLRTIRENPIPAAIAGASLAWLFTKNNSSAQRTLRYAGNVVGNVSSSTGDAAGNLAGTAGDAVSNVAGAAGDAVGTVASTVKEQGQQAQSQLHRMLLDNPLAVGAAAVAIGAVVGLAVPETPQENQLMGQARDALFEKAQTAAQDTLQKVQQVTQEAGHANQQEAEYQGLV
ncbi:MAG TPA: DUF3618 domain-containing protein [Chloroflexia bacterium]|nr:DUF3618 domain-containing protein [Chloroflexia bacterium]